MRQPSSCAETRLLISIHGFFDHGPDIPEMPAVATRSLTVKIPAIGDVDALLLRPESARWLLVLAHGAGAGMQHPFMNGFATALADCGLATFRYHFPYMQQQRKRPDAAPVLTAAVRAAIAMASEVASDLPLFAGGKSLGGRMTSLACAGDASDDTGGMPRVRGIVFVGFPLHPAGRPGRQRAEHLARVRSPMLFLQGTRDQLADIALIRALCAELGPAADLHVVDGGDHSFHVLRRSGRTDADILRELAGTVAAWGDALLA
jgi:predicted alpha/beta-hydrolase family hydrolase